MNQDVKKPGAGTPGSLSEDQQGGGSSMSVQRPGVDAGEAAGLWAEAQITALVPQGHIPEYGSPDWLALAPADPRRTAAVITAAEQWRRHVHLLSNPAEWFRQATKDADDHARRVIRQLNLARLDSYAQLAEKRQPQPAHELKATKGWPPIRIPGGNGRYLTYSEKRAA